jgi:hypothetical protein
MMRKTLLGAAAGLSQPFFHSFLALRCRIGIIDLLAVMSTAVYL